MLWPGWGEKHSQACTHKPFWLEWALSGNQEVKGVLVSDGLNDCGNLFRCCNSAAWQRTAETLSGSGHCWNTSILHTSRAEYLIWKSVVHSLSERDPPNRNSL